MCPITDHPFYYILNILFYDKMVPRVYKLNNQTV
jgi:hypothetical protein